MIVLHVTKQAVLVVAWTVLFTVARCLSVLSAKCSEACSWFPRGIACSHYLRLANWIGNKLSRSCSGTVDAVRYHINPGSYWSVMLVIVCHIWTTFPNVCIFDTKPPFDLTDDVNFYTAFKRETKMHGGTFPAKPGFYESDRFQKAVKIVLRCILIVILHLSLVSGLKL